MWAPWRALVACCTRTCIHFRFFATAACWEDLPWRANRDFCWISSCFEDIRSKTGYSELDKHSRPVFWFVLITHWVQILSTAIFCGCRDTIAASIAQFITKNRFMADKSCYLIMEQTGRRNLRTAEEESPHEFDTPSFVIQPACCRLNTWFYLRYLYLHLLTADAIAESPCLLLLLLRLSFSFVAVASVQMLVLLRLLCSQAGCCMN